MQKVKGVCNECGGDGERQSVGYSSGPGSSTHLVYRDRPKCTHCGGSGMEPKKGDGIDVRIEFLWAWANATNSNVPVINSLRKINVLQRYDITAERAEEFFQDFLDQREGL